MRRGFDNDKYLEVQAQKIRQRIAQFGGKLYLEFGGKLLDDYHASRVLPGFEPDSKARMLELLANDAEVVFAINANDIESGKRRGDIGIARAIDHALRKDGEPTRLILGNCTRNAPFLQHRFAKLGVQPHLHARRQHRFFQHVGQRDGVKMALVPLGVGPAKAQSNGAAVQFIADG